jgi:outer membrane protein
MKSLLSRSLIALLLTASTVVGQERLNMDRAVGIALEQNRTLRAAALDVEASRWGKVNSYGNLLPKVEISAGVTRIDPQSEHLANAALDFIKSTGAIFGIPPETFKDMRPFAYRDTYGTQLTVVQPIYNGGAELVGLDAAAAERERSGYAFDDAEQNVIARVKTSYLTVLKAQELVALAGENAQRIKRWLEMTRRRAEAGMRTKTDVMRWEVEYADAENSIIRAENGLALATLQLNEVLGVDLNAQFTLEKVDSGDAILADALTSPLASLVVLQDAPVQSQDFLMQHPAMNMMRANLELADAQVSGAWTHFKPRINAAFQYGWEKNSTLALDGIRPWALSLSVSYPLFNGFGDYANLQKAQAEMKKAETQVETYERGLLMQATSAELNLKAARKRLDVTLKARDQAREVLGAVERRYETGGLSNVDLIDVQTASLSAETSYITATYDCTIARIEYARATGTVTR